ncbi:hypothetical protein PSQ19_06175 [Devosia algicola]|uniref:Uncharacterized protein n=1 Tax=Devosia algicola TaxID=3026418 RepID=A0ABY7YRK8_9HYPH|nr:hypothetical protein [Devosia algicola]WDR03654.1 hypothetical protein PSQ19_06175 [Devosia algicola]
MAVTNRPPADILHRLRFFADAIDDVPIRDLEAILREAADHIAEVRKMAGMNNPADISSMTPHGNA